MDSKAEFDRFMAERDVNRAGAARPAIVVDNPSPEPVGAPVPGAMAVLALTAILVSCVLWVCRLFGAVDWSAVWLLSPMWGSSLLIALAFAVADVVDRVRERRS